MCWAQMTIMYSNPVLCALLAWALRGERLGAVACLGIGATLAGVVLVSQPPFLFGGHAWTHMRLLGARLVSAPFVPDVACPFRRPCLSMRSGF